MYRPTFSDVEALLTRCPEHGYQVGPMTVQRLSLGLLFKTLSSRFAFPVLVGDLHGWKGGY